jgi:hypothetical protein
LFFSQAKPSVRSRNQRRPTSKTWKRISLLEQKFSEKNLKTFAKKKYFAAFFHSFYLTQLRLISLHCIYFWLVVIYNLQLNNSSRGPHSFWRLAVNIDQLYLITFDLLCTGQRNNISRSKVAHAHTFTLGVVVWIWLQFHNILNSLNLTPENVKV